jgi:hypothetical protein
MNNSSSAKRRKLDLDPDGGINGSKKGKKKIINDTDKDVLRAREVMLYGAAVRSASGPGRSRGTDLDLDFGFGDGTRDGVFKIPVVPMRAKSVGKGKGRVQVVEPEADVFGPDDTGVRGAKRKGRWKDEGEEEREAEVGEVEKANRVVRISSSLSIHTLPSFRFQT